jgi:hypothetical protein
MFLLFLHPLPEERETRSGFVFSPWERAGVRVFVLPSH